MSAAHADDQPSACVASQEPSTFGAAGRSLDEAIARALAHSPEVAMAEAKVAQADAQLRSAKHGWFRPQVSVYAGDSIFSGTMRGGIQVTQDLDRLLTLNRDEVRQAHHALLLARQELILAKERVVRHTQEAWATSQRLDALTHRRAQAVWRREQLYHLTQTPFEVGAVSLDHLLGTQQALAQAEQDLLEAQLALRTAQGAFAQLLGEDWSGYGLSTMDYGRREAR